MTSEDTPLSQMSGNDLDLTLSSSTVGDSISNPILSTALQLDDYPTMYRNAAANAYHASISMQRAWEALHQIVDTTEVMANRTNISDQTPFASIVGDEMSNRQGASEADVLIANYTPETLVRHSLGAACLLMETAMKRSSTAFAECSQLLAPTLNEAGVCVVENEGWMKLRRKINIDLANQEEGESHSCAVQEPMLMEDNDFVMPAIKWKEVIYVDNDDESNENIENVVECDDEQQVAGSVDESDEESPVQQLRKRSALVSESSSTALIILSNSAPSRRRKRQQSTRMEPQADDDQETTTHPSPKHQPSRDKIIETVIAAMERDQPEIEAAIRHDKGVPPGLHLLAISLDDLEQRFLCQRGLHTMTEIESSLATVISQTCRVADNWGPYFRGRSFALLKIAKRLSGEGIVKYMQRRGVEISATTVNDSVKYYGFCKTFCALPWTKLSFSTVVAHGSAMSEDTHFKAVMQKLGDVVVKASAENAEEVTPSSVYAEDDGSVNGGVLTESELFPRQETTAPLSFNEWDNDLPTATTTSMVLSTVFDRVDENSYLIIEKLATVGDGICIQPSTLSGAGLGLFAAQAFSGGSKITGYAGKLISREDALLRRQNGQDSHIVRAGEFAFHSHYVDGIAADQLKMGMYGGSACNHKPGMEANARLVHFDPPNERVEIQAIRNIGIGEEIFVDYGRTYWNLRELMEG